MNKGFAKEIERKYRVVKIKNNGLKKGHLRFFSFRVLLNIFKSSTKSPTFTLKLFFIFNLKLCHFFQGGEIYDRKKFYEIFMENISKLIRENFRDGTKGSSDHLRLIRVRKIDHARITQDKNLK